MLRPVLGPPDVGSRVVVRRRLPGALTDVLGELVQFGSDGLVVRRSDGAEVPVAHADVVAAKRVPPAPRPTPRQVRELERAAALGWQAVQTRELGGWLLRASEGFTGRANSVLPLGDPGCALDDALGSVRDWYAERSLPPRFQLPLPSALDDALAQRGWPAYNPTMVMTADRVDAGDADGVEIAAVPGPAWLAAYHYRGADELPPVATRLLLSAPEQAFAAVYDGERAVAIGRVAVGAGWAGITAMEVAPAARRRGLGRRVLAALCRAGEAAGADRFYLQVAVENAGARALYEQVGFREHHRYHYRWMPP